MTDFPPNSAKARQPEGPPPGERPKVERVVSAEARRRKRGLGRQFKETFIGGTARGAVEYVVTDVVVPTIKEMVFEAFQTGMQRLIFGESRVRRGAPPPSYSNVGRVNYQGMSTSSKPPTRTVSSQSRSRGSFDEIVIASRVEAQEVLDRMFDILSRYEVVLVADLYELTGIQTSHADQRWGWRSLPGAKVARLSSGEYVLDIPAPEPLN